MKTTKGRGLPFWRRRLANPAVVIENFLARLTAAEWDGIPEGQRLVARGVKPGQERFYIQKGEPNVLTQTVISREAA